MKRSSKATAVVAILGLVAGGAVYASGDDPLTHQRPDDEVVEDEDTPITGPALERAMAAALAAVGEGRVTATEVGDEEGYYEVEVTLRDGSQVDVHLDEDFQLLGIEGDGEEDGD